MCQAGLYLCKVCREFIEIDDNGQIDYTFITPLDTKSPNCHLCEQEFTSLDIRHSHQRQATNRDCLFKCDDINGCQFYSYDMSQLYLHKLERHIATRNRDLKVELVPDNNEIPQNLK